MNHTLSPGKQAIFATSKTYIASDASGGEEGSPNLAGAVCLFDGEISSCEVQIWPFPKDLESKEIHTKELYAAVQAIDHWAKIGDRVFLAIDNTTARAAIRHLHTGCPHMKRPLERLVSIRDERRLDVETFFIFSEDNIADCPSRNAPLDRNRYKETWCLLSGEFMYMWPDKDSDEPRNAKIRTRDLSDLPYAQRHDFRGLPSARSAGHKSSRD